MTESDNTNAFHESVRQRMAAYEPAFDPDNWQRMRRKLRRDRWQKLAGLLLGSFVLIGIIWYAMDNKETSSTTTKPTVVTRKSHPGKPLAERSTRFRDIIKPQLIKRLTRNTLQITQPERSANYVGDVLPLEVHLSQPLVGESKFKLPPVILHSPDEADIIRRVTKGDIGSDSTTYRVFSRNLLRWSDAVVVCDFTSSMYPYSTQLMAWFQRNQASQQVKGIVFFTDCDSLGHETGPGRTGQLFSTRSRSVKDVLPIMLASARNTMGNRGSAENNLDALVYAQNQFPEASQLVLIADNSSTVKDLDRLPELHKPVHIILCGPTEDTAKAFQPDYYRIAQQTGGSLHTLEDDLTALAQLPPKIWIRVDQRYYRLNRRGNFVLSGFRHRPRRFLGLFWR